MQTFNSHSPRTSSLTDIPLVYPLERWIHSNIFVQQEIEQIKEDGKSWCVEWCINNDKR